MGILNARPVTAGKSAVQEKVRYAKKHARKEAAEHRAQMVKDPPAASLKEKAKKYKSAQKRPVTAGKHPRKGPAPLPIRLAILQDKVNDLMKIIGDAIPVDPFGASQAHGHMQNWGGVPLIFDCTLDAIHPECRHVIEKWIANNADVYEENNDQPTGNLYKETLWVEAILQVYNQHPSDIFQTGANENPGYKLLKYRAFNKLSVPAIHHLQALLTGVWHELLGEYCKPTCQERDEIILKLEIVADTNVKIDSLFRRTEGPQPTFWRPQMENLANNRFADWEKFIRIVLPTGDQDNWTLPQGNEYSLEAEKRAYRLIYEHLQRQRDLYLFGFVATDTITQEQADELRAEVAAVPDGPFELEQVTEDEYQGFYRPSVVPEEGEPAPDVIKVPDLTWKAPKKKRDKHLEYLLDECATRSDAVVLPGYEDLDIRGDLGEADFIELGWLPAGTCAAKRGPKRLKEPLKKPIIVVTDDEDSDTWTLDEEED